ncbi:alpha/beta hydrolase [Actinomadura darangshiensis]|uniref:Alpha/beta hydrolase n=1 Tax=Actinomadura darangshiensis TaxID=705336 RepID=A0A4R5BRK7_9ACTN|nr:alpha/beta hydrolase [Actinomadura darangshiensis]TDD89631.1 alpha/beta hydrolase [Actinomadura darangshiensis]
MESIELPAGTIDFEDTGGDGPVVVLLHGLLMDATLWADVVAELRGDHRCVAPTLPLGAHTRPMRDGTDLTPHGIARLVGEFLEALDLHDVVLIGNDTGGAVVQLLAAEKAARIGSIVLVSCDAFGNFPPGLTGKTIVLTGKLPPAVFGVFMQQMRLKPMRRLPISFGWLTRRGDATVARWLKPVLTQPDVRRDTVRVLRGISAERKVLLDAAERLRAFDRPALVVWAERDRVMPPEHGRRLAELLPQGRLTEVPDSRTLVPLDQPLVLARAIRAFTSQEVPPDRP